ncbi:cuticle protein 19-like [Daktulosphaira vitifoliae]|uniref:cuticle protein 19-like n=1 Tax=Daktulosphaira vitifoliae TaxID=58002 RepID=UPI0021AAD12F|nr:cuticle protein 19-like [Daktulosphaira vitifoliae]
MNIFKMTTKVIIFFAICIAFTLAQYAYKPVVPLAVYSAKHYEEPIYPPIPYNFQYSVNDPSTYDVKSQSEYSDGKTVKGFYSLVESDGTKRVVEYTADDYGFNAQVKKEGASYV